MPLRALFAAAALGAVALAAVPAAAQYYYHPGYYPPPGYYVPAPPPPPPPRDLNRAYDPERDGPLGYPTQRGPVLYGSTCYAGNYVCQLPAPGPVGSGCSCPALGAPSYGTIR
jgi:hypothetical protein